MMYYAANMVQDIIVAFLYCHFAPKQYKEHQTYTDYDKKWYLSNRPQDISQVSSLFSANHSLVAG